MDKILLKGGEVASSLGVELADVLIEDGVIKEVGANLSIDGAEVIDCSGRVVMPGAIDVHVHFREPGGEEKEDFNSGSKAAVSGGVTTVFDMPNNNPPILSCDDLEMKRGLINGRSYCNYGLYIGYNGENVEEINAAEGIAGVKVYCAHSTGNMGIEGDGYLEKAFTEIDRSKKLLFHAEDEDIIEKNYKKFVEGRKKVAVFTHSKVRSKEAAVKMTTELCELAKKHERPIHICHVSTGEELEIISEYREYGVTCEVAPHHLVFSTADYDSMGSFIKMNPPVRSGKDLFALWKGLQEGLVDIIATDHAPHTREEKEKGGFNAPSGVPGVEMMIPIMLNAVDMQSVSLEEVVYLCCERPADIFGISKKGKVEAGFDADIVVVDLEKQKNLKNSDVVSKCGWTPYAGGLYKGWPVLTMISGEIVWDKGKFIEGCKGSEVVFS